MKSVFISGSIAIKNIPTGVRRSIDKIISENIQILVGDADGVDTLVQNYCKKQNYNNVVVYSISAPRFKVLEFEHRIINVDTNSKKERERQREKDSAMTIDSDFNLIIWDGKSKGSYNNILRAIEKEKKIKLYLSKADKFLETNKITKNEITFIFRENNGYTSKEIVEHLKNQQGIDYFKNARQLNEYLLKKSIIKKGTNESGRRFYMPLPGHEKLFIIDKYRGQVTGIKFKDGFIGWIEKNLKETKQSEHSNVFDSNNESLQQTV